VDFAPAGRRVDLWHGDVGVSRRRAIMRRDTLAVAGRCRYLRPVSSSLAISAVTASMPDTNVWKLVDLQARVRPIRDA
jgi:hypothetical protein